MKPYGILWWVKLLLAIIPFTPLITGVVKQKDRSQTSFTWFLYLILDLITLLSTKNEREEYDPMLLGFAVGSFTMTFVLVLQKRFAEIRTNEIVTMSLIIVCGVIWKLLGTHLTIRVAILSEAIVGIYLIIQTYKFPTYKYNLSGYLLFSLISMISTITIRDCTIAEAGFAISETILNIIILIPLVKKWYEDNSSEIFYFVIGNYLRITGRLV